MEKLRSFVRPFLTVTGWIAILILAFSIDDIRARLIDAVMMMVAFWFGERKK